MLSSTIARANAVRAGFAAAMLFALAACADSTTSPSTNHHAPLFSQGPSGGGGGGTSGGGGTGGGGTGGGGGGNRVSQFFIIATPPTVNTTGTWSGPVIGLTAPVTFTLLQSATGIVSGTAQNRGIVGLVESVSGTVNGDTLQLYIGNLCGACTLASAFTGIVNSTATQMTGTLWGVSASPFTAAKQ